MIGIKLSLTLQLILLFDFYLYQVMRNEVINNTSHCVMLIIQSFCVLSVDTIFFSPITNMNLSFFKLQLHEHGTLNIIDLQYSKNIKFQITMRCHAMFDYLPYRVFSIIYVFLTVHVRLNLLSDYITLIFKRILQCNDYYWKQDRQLGQTSHRGCMSSM